MESVIINSVDRALDILDYLCKYEKEVSITQISQDLGVYKSTVYRTLVTLENKNYVTKNPETEKYSLSMKLFIMGNSVGKKVGLQKIVAPYAKELYDEFHESVNVSILEHNKNEPYYSVMVYTEENKQILSFNTSLFSRNECYCASVGKCLLAFQPDLDLSIYEKYPMTQYTQKTITTIMELEKELEKVKKQGFAVDDEERELGLTCIGAPILDSHGIAIAAISLSGPTSRMKDSTYEEKIQRIKEIGEKISLKMQ